MELMAERFSLEEVLENVLNLFIVRAEEKGLELVLELDPTAPPYLIGDALRLGQVLNNLVGNAVKFTEAGEIHIKVSQLSNTRDYSTLKFSVRDTGIGMTTEQVTHLFQAFTQADGSITRRFGGTGLGLTISKRLVAMMGGELIVQSQVHEGSVFGFTLRLPFPVEQKANQMPSHLQSMRVLIVDDLDISRQILRDILLAWGFQVVEAASGEDALACLRTANDANLDFELVLLDWKMPGLDGVQVTRAIREMVLGEEIRHAPVVIMVTAFSREKLLRAAGDAMPDEVLIKPVMPSTLMDALTRLQGGKIDQTDDSRPQLAAMAAPIRGAHILLVEDNEVNQIVAREYLESAGLFVTVANNGREGVEAVRTASFDAVLMDLQMPEMSGLEASRLIRQDTRFADLPIIAMTAAVQERERNDCYAAGMDEHVGKPVLPQTLLSALVRCIKPMTQSAPAAAIGTPTESAVTGLPYLLPGFDMDYIRIIMGTNGEKLHHLLDRFHEKFASSADDWHHLLCNGKTDLAMERLHNLKGAAGAIGAVELNQTTARLEERLNNGAPIDDDITAFEHSLASTLQTIANFTASVTATESGGEDSDWLTATALTAKLRLLLNGSDFVPHELMALLKNALPGHDTQRLLLQIEKQVGNIDYSQALETLAELESLIAPHLARESR